MAVKWVKQLTRENTLLDRSLRSLAYKNSLSEIGRASMSNVLLVGRGNITSMYYLPSDYKRQQQTILGEFRGKRIEEMAKSIMGYLEEGYLWAKSRRRKNLSKKDFLKYLESFNRHHSHSRGAIVYGYWGEPAITGKLKKALSSKFKKKELDNIISVLSIPHALSGPLKELRPGHPGLEKKKQALIRKINPDAKTLELIEVLGWFTLFYEMGELVSSYLYDEFIRQLKKIIKNKKDLEKIDWYDPYSLKAYLKGKTLNSAEIERRKDFWILEILGGNWNLLIGKQARNYFFSNVPQAVVKSDSQLAGTVACRGKVKGRAKIIVTRADQSKMNDGDILVSPMTTPRLMSAVKKAAAIVTDEGGMTAHAAIVSREFNIPCIVGTKFATQILKDGDMIEVDADNGIIKKI